MNAYFVALFMFWLANVVMVLVLSGTAKTWKQDVWKALYFQKTFPNGDVINRLCELAVLTNVANRISERDQWRREFIWAQKVAKEAGFGSFGTIQDYFTMSEETLQFWMNATRPK